MQVIQNLYYNSSEIADNIINTLDLIKKSGMN